MNPNRGMLRAQQSFGPSIETSVIQRSICSLESHPLVVETAIDGVIHRPRTSTTEVIREQFDRVIHDTFC